MNEHGTVNSQIVDSVADVVTLTGGHAPAHAFGMLDAVMVETRGMAMYNAVSRQQGGSMIGSAAVTAVCAKMLNAPFTLPPKPSPPLPPKPPHVHPLPPVQEPASVVIKTAAAEAEFAISKLRAEAEKSGEDAADAKKSLSEIATDASKSIPAPDPTPVPIVPTPPYEGSSPAADQER